MEDTNSALSFLYFDVFSPLKSINHCVFFTGFSWYDFRLSRSLFYLESLPLSNGHQLFHSSCAPSLVHISPDQWDIIVVGIDFSTCPDKHSVMVRESVLGELAVTVLTKCETR